MNPGKNERCPICLVDLTQEDRQGLHVGVCPQCRSFWVERRELDRVLSQDCPKFLRPDFFERRQDHEHSR